MKARGRLLELDCLRGIAAAIVVAFHLALGQPATGTFFDFGVAGVELFFMISGFVIFLTIEKTTRYQDFLFSRFARLYPAYWVCVTLTALAIVSWSHAAKVNYTFPTLTDYLLNLTMFEYYFKVKYVDGVYWTLTIEVSFYLFILAIYLIKKLHRMELIGFFLVLVCLVNGLVLKRYAADAYTDITKALPIITYFPLFVAGIVFYKIKFYEFTIYRLLLVTLCWATQISLFDCTNKVLYMQQPEYAIIVTIFFIAFFLYCFNHLQFIVNKVTLFLGKISYSLYLIHNYIATVLLIPIFKSNRYFHINLAIAIIFVIAPAMIITAALITKYIEFPAMKYLKRKLIKLD